MDSLNNISDKTEHIRLLGTEKAMWMDYAVKDIKDTMTETIEVYEEMLKIRNDEMMERAAMEYWLADKEMIERYKKQEEKIIQLCKEDEEIQNVLDKYENEFNQRLDIDKVVSVLIVEKAELLFMESEQTIDDTIALIRSLTDKSRDGNRVYKKVIIKEKEKQWEKLIRRIESIITKYRKEQMESVSTEEISHNEKLLEKAIKSVDDRKELFKKLQDYAKCVEASIK